MAGSPILPSNSEKEEYLVNQICSHYYLETQSSILTYSSIIPIQQLSLLKSVYKINETVFGSLINFFTVHIVNQRNKGSKKTNGLSFIIFPGIFYTV